MMLLDGHNIFLLPLFTGNQFGFFNRSFVRLTKPHAHLAVSTQGQEEKVAGQDSNLDPHALIRAPDHYTKVAQAARRSLIWLNEPAVGEHITAAVVSELFYVLLLLITLNCSLTARQVLSHSIHRKSIHR